MGWTGDYFLLRRFSTRQKAEFVQSRRKLLLFVKHTTPPHTTHLHVTCPCTCTCCTCVHVLTCSHGLAIYMCMDMHADPGLFVRHPTGTVLRISGLNTRSQFILVMPGNRSGRGCLLSCGSPLSRLSPWSAAPYGFVYCIDISNVFGNILYQMAWQRGLAPKIDNKTMCWRENKQLSAAPALRRLGRTGLEAPPLRGRKILSF